MQVVDGTVPRALDPSLGPLVQKYAASVAFLHCGSLPIIWLLVGTTDGKLLVWDYEERAIICELEVGCVGVLTYVGVVPRSRRSGEEAGGEVWLILGEGCTLKALPAKVQI